MKSRLSYLMEPDRNQGPDGYTIRSLYFDTEDNRLLNESINGDNYRNKYRIRTYNNDDGFIRFEKKTTIGNKKSKESLRLIKRDVFRLKEGDTLCNIGDNLAEEINILIKTERLSPKIIVEYDRYAFVSDIGNIRITFDRNIRASEKTDEFFEDPLMLPILPYNRHVLEVKYDGLFPGYIARILKLEELERVSFSKYSLAYNVIENNGRLLETYEY